MRKRNFRNTDEILTSIEGIHRATAPDFFYTRLRARMEKGMPSPAGRKRMMQPAFIISGLVLLLLINAIILLRNNSNGNVITAPARENDNLQIIATAYHINDGLPVELNQ